MPKNGKLKEQKRKTRTNERFYFFGFVFFFKYKIVQNKPNFFFMNGVTNLTPDLKRANLTHEI